MRAARGFLIPGILLAIAALAAALAADVRESGRALATGDGLYYTSPATTSWHGSLRLPAGLTEGLLAIDDDLTARSALQLYRANAFRRGRLDNAIEVAGDRAETDAALARMARSRDAAKAAKARILLGVLAFGDFARGGGKSIGQAESAIAFFDSAVHIDPSSEAAKYDLELALRALAARGVRVGPGSGSGTGSTGRKGAGGSVPGRGY